MVNVIFNFPAYMDEMVSALLLQHGLGRSPVLQAKTTMGRVQYSTARVLVYRLLNAMPKL